MKNGGKNKCCVYNFGQYISAVKHRRPLLRLFFPKKNAQTLVSEYRRYCCARSCFPSTRTHLSLCLSAPFLFSTGTHISLSPRLLRKRTHISLSPRLLRKRTHISLSLSPHMLSFCSTRGREEQSLIQLKTDIMLLASLSLHASIAKITAQLLSLSYGYFI